MTLDSLNEDLKSIWECLGLSEYNDPVTSRGNLKLKARKMSVRTTGLLTVFGMGTSLIWTELLTI
jgi:hypothetical protein